MDFVLSLLNIRLMRVGDTGFQTNSGAVSNQDKSCNGIDGVPYWNFDAFS